jgi:hypothetical protein
VILKLTVATELPTGFLINVYDFHGPTSKQQQNWTHKKLAVGNVWKYEKSEINQPMNESINKKQMETKEQKMKRKVNTDKQ